MAKSRGGSRRSAKTGRYVKPATAARHPRTTVRETTGGKSSKAGKAYRSAITDRYVTAATVARHPDTTVTENG